MPSGSPVIPPCAPSSVGRDGPAGGVILDLASAESPTFGGQEGSAWNGHFR
jgi:hypothetical protein